jgi:glycosyltransferase involved in cell wall biosynthesis
MPTAKPPLPDGPAIELTIVMPCLNEGETLESCILKAQRALQEGHIRGEIIVGDNGSTDNSVVIAKRLGVRVVEVRAKGYGNALMGGIAAAAGKYILMGDADDSYDFQEAPRFLAKLREGYDLVQGCRLPSGGGTVMKGAMPFSHRWVGNPVFSFMAKTMFAAPIHDVYCGLRAFTRELYQRLELRCIGMEFATEMIIKSSLHGARIAEIPITLHPDGRVTHKPHLKTIRDGWRTLRFFLMFSPRWLFLYPGLALISLGFAGYALALPRMDIGKLHFDAHTLLFASLAILLGYQAVLFAILAKTFAIAEKLLPEDPKLTRFYQTVNLERGLLLGAVAMLLGLFLLADTVYQWQLAGFGHLDYSRTMRWAIPGVTLCALGFQTVLFGFFASILGLARK